MKRQRVIRDFEAGGNLDLFLVTSVAAVLLIRLFLQITGFPQLGNDSLHIAHMLWGGLLMLVAVIILLSFIGRSGHKLAAVLGGAGFGTFIDEVGKFVTQDNDYFFSPTPAIIYIVMILTYLGIRWIHTRPPRTNIEYFVNALQEVQQIAVGDLDSRERDRALSYLAHCNSPNPLVDGLRRLIHGSDVVDPPRPGPITRMRTKARDFYRAIGEKRWFTGVVVAFFVGQLVVQMLHIFFLLVFDKSWLTALMRRSLDTLGSASTHISYFELSLMAFSALAAIFVAIGAWQIRRCRLSAFHNFLRSILVSLFLIQPLMFYRDQWSALIGLAFDIVVFVALRFIIEREQLSAIESTVSQEASP
jgi:hypothetical protein